ncbi:hypothetical protein GS393_02087 [Pseudomonas savastanoi pv. phaseolicola]|uniref:hypothetical protein n=1 Tax=Pseudomonas savastanoi TaxID=29438 RepID=UPI0013C30AFC|nr:hypothetical protein [Pseudomonas savastanoi]MBN4180638.1 hypothetical protein [Pseudomonas savastanoi pv. phaseolicola]
MDTVEKSWYDQLLLALEDRYPAENSSPMAKIRARNQRLPIYALSALGNALAQARGWPLKGMDAVDFAIIRKYSWFLPQVQALPPASKWLALHEDLLSLPIDQAAIEAWGVKNPEPVEVDLLGWVVNPSGLPPA